eukprot:6197657-Pleurochrysis_carterae.AAC.11
MLCTIQYYIRVKGKAPLGATSSSAATLPGLHGHAVDTPLTDYQSASIAFRGLTIPCSARPNYRTQSKRSYEAAAYV